MGRVGVAAPPPPRAGFRAGRIPARPLDGVMLNVVNVNAPAGSGSIESVERLYFDALRTTERGAEQPMNALTRERVVTALVAAHRKKLVSEPGGDPNALYLARELPIRVFNGYSDAQQIAFAVNIWNRICEGVVPTVQGQAMREGDGSVSGTSTPLPTSLQPLSLHNPQVTVRQRQANAWRDVTIGFRVEGKKSANTDDLARFRQFGCQPLAHNEAALLAVRGMRVSTMPVAAQDRVFFWNSDRDVFNETGTCVSRSLLGATAFPERSTNTRTEPGTVEFHYVVAVDCRDLTGVDSEDWQISRGKLNNWRPGEKAFLGIPPQRVLAWTKLLRRPGGRGGGWGFTLSEGRWNWINPLDDARKEYVEAELRAWSHNVWYEVPGDYDFAS